MYFLSGLVLVVVSAFKIWQSERRFKMNSLKYSPILNGDVKGRQAFVCVAGVGIGNGILISNAVAGIGNWEFASTRMCVAMAICLSVMVACLALNVAAACHVCRRGL